MTFAVGDACVDVLDRSCLAVCPADCIYEGGRRAYIHPGECIDCGVCLPACPVDAITAEGYSGPQGSTNVRENLAFFVEVLPTRAAALGSPGGAHAVGRVGADIQRVRELP
jgi:Fe-S-cluster-containing hydrogenase component 2